MSLLDEDRLFGDNSDAEFVSLPDGRVIDRRKVIVLCSGSDSKKPEQAKNDQEVRVINGNYGSFDRIFE